MKGIPVVKSKLIMPQLSNSFIRLERIKKLSKAMHNPSVVTITAPAGYGKTTLIVAALNMYPLNHRICWYRLEQEDRDLAVFYIHFIEALFPAGEKSWADSGSYLANCGDIHSQYQYLNALICQELWAFHEHHKKIKTFIVLDDFQQVKDSPEIFGSVRYLINNLPENCSIFVSSRSQTDILTVKQRLEKDFLEVSSEELCFSEEELAEFLREIYGIKADKKFVQKIMSNTEGWAAGIIMMCQALSKCSIQGMGSLLEKSGEKDLLFKYFALEVLKTVDSELMLFLVKAALLREFTAAEAGAVLNVEDVLQLLAQCEKKGLFIQKVVGEVTTYRFHGLFRDVLLQAQPEYLTAEQIENYHLKAAACYIESRFFNRAIEHFIACGNVPLAVELITRESVNLITLEAFEQLRLWFKLLPDEVVNNNAILLLIKSYTYQKGEEEALILLKRALSIFKENNDVKMQIKTLFTLLAFYLFRNDAGNAVSTMNQAQVLAKAAKGTPLADLIAVTQLAKAVWAEKYSGGIAACSRANCLWLDEDWKWTTLMYSCLLHCLLGELNAAESFIKEALEMDLVRSTKMLKGFTLSFYSTVLQLKNDRSAFSSAKDELMDIGENYNNAYMIGFGKRLSAFERYCVHDLETALEMLESSTKHFEQLGNQAMYALNKLSQCLWLSRQRNPKELLEAAKESFKVLASSRPGFCLIEIGQSVLGALAREAGDYEFAGQALLSSIKKSRSKKAKQVLCGSYLHLAKLYYDTGDKVSGEDALRQAFHSASGSGYVMFWDLHLPTLVEMSARCVKSNIYSEYALELMATYFGKDAAEFFKNNAAITEESYLKDFCDAFISLYGIKNETFSTRIDVCLLGRFSIAVNGRAIPENSWKTRKIEGVLKYLILHRGRTITRESLMELFWPGSDKKSASMSLRAALYELRKVLKLYGILSEGKDSLIHEKSSGLMVLAGGMLSVDTDRFLSLHNELKGLPSGESGRLQRIGVLERMVALYRGNLLEGELYEDWAFFEREEHKSIFLEAALSLASVYVERKENEKAEKLLLKTLALDQYNEEACFCLLKLYISTNQRSRAVKLYTNFKNRLEKDLNVRPDERLASVVRQVN